MPCIASKRYLRALLLLQRGEGQRSFLRCRLSKRSPDVKSERQCEAESKDSGAQIYRSRLTLFTPVPALIAIRASSFEARRNRNNQ
jgi:hypothetical protein